MKKKGFTLIEVIAAISILVIFFVSLNLSVDYIKKLQEPTLDEFFDTFVNSMYNARLYCINNESRGEIQQIKENGEMVIRFKSKRFELTKLYVPKDIDVLIHDTNMYKRQITIDKYGSITPSKDIIIRNNEEERIIKVNFYSRGMYEK